MKSSTRHRFSARIALAIATIAALVLVPTTVASATDPASGTIGGRVTAFGSSTLGISGARVTVQDVLGNTVTDTATNTGGYYSITGLAAGQYKVNAVGPDYDSVDYYKDSLWDQTWYGGYLRLGSATIITVAVDGTLSNVNIPLHRDTKIEGTIGNAADADITLTTTAGTVVDETEAGSNGKYQFNDVAPGLYRVHLADSERPFTFLSNPSLWYGGGTLASSKEVRATAEHVTTGINISPDSVGYIFGKVAVPLGVAPVTTVQLKTTAGQLVDSTTVNGSSGGTWNIAATPGTYLIDFVSSDGYFGSGYYNSAGRLGSASHVSVGSGASITLKTINLGTLPQGQITGRVSMSDGTSPAGIEVGAVRDGITQYMEAVPDPATVAADGTFTISNVPAGKYTVEFGNGEDVGPMYYFNRFAQGAVVTVTSGHTLALETQTLTPMTWVSGTVTDNGSPAATAQVEFYTPGGHLVATASVSSGSYSVAIPKGTYRVRFLDRLDPTKGATWLGGGQSFATSETVDTAVSTRADGSLAAGSTITGIAVDEVTHLPLDSLGATLYRLLPDGSWQAGAYQAAITDGTGHYTLTGVSTGEYVIEFSEVPEQYTTYHVSYSGKSESIAGATPIVVSSVGQTVTAPTSYIFPGYSTATNYGTPNKQPAQAPATSHDAAKPIAVRASLS